MTRDITTPDTTTGPSGAGAREDTVAPGWLIERDLDAVAAHLDRWILAAEPDHQPASTAVPLLGTPDWVAADTATRDAAVAIYVLACLAEREPVVIAARLAAEIAAGRTAHLVAMRQASHAVSAALAGEASGGDRRTCTAGRVDEQVAP